MFYLFLFEKANTLNSLKWLEALFKTLLPGIVPLNVNQQLPHKVEQKKCDDLSEQASLFASFSRSRNTSENRTEIIHNND